MPQLMPLYWMNSVFMIFFVIISMNIFYFYKNKKYLHLMQWEKLEKLNNYKW
uniref:ATP synthase F0 subunit 8 n=1 Tax=Lycosa shansia TaxID=2830340 RepID=UPI002176C673|nr:ATP synthase F0 subunit 8 [Lycosa shansia]UUC05140.1 ATP synthase F0 subunit 8 [Lycosa shansia]